MDDGAGSGTPGRDLDDNVGVSLSYTPPRRLVVGYGMVAALAAVAVLFVDPAGAILAGAVAVVFAGLTVRDTVAVPRLLVDERGLTVRRLTGRHQVRWADVEQVVVDRRSRFGRTVHTLEIDVDSGLLLFGESALGADPVAAARQIVAMAPAARRVDLGGRGGAPWLRPRRDR